MTAVYWVGFIMLGRTGLSLNEAQVGYSLTRPNSRARQRARRSTL